MIIIIFSLLHSLKRKQKKLNKFLQKQEAKIEATRKLNDVVDEVKKITEAENKVKNKKKKTADDKKENTEIKKEDNKPEIEVKEIKVENNKITERSNLKVGVADLLNAFPDANQSISKVSIEEVEEFVKEKLTGEKFSENYDCAIFTGGEERFELLTDFPLEKNTLFQDGIHKYMISTEKYVESSKKVFFEITLEQLYELMPQNPKWMDGARLGAILPLAIFHLANIPYIVPSDLNLINGVINDQK